jgi:CDP-diacylglycerol--serine O-phosphatidyltransferase
MIAMLLTAGNLVCGTLALALLTVPPVLGWGGPYTATAVWTLVLAGVLDAVDGPLARRLHRRRITWGAEFDALADLVSFAVAPAVLAVTTAPRALVVSLAAAGTGFVLAGAWRLARHIRTGPRPGAGRFEGMPVTGAGLLLCAWWLFGQETGLGRTFPFGAGLLMVSGAALMVSRIPYEKFPELGGTTPRERVKWALSALVVTAIALRPALVGLPVALLYTASGPFNALRHAARRPVRGYLDFFEKKGGPDEP